MGLIRDRETNAAAARAAVTAGTSVLLMRSYEEMKVQDMLQAVEQATELLKSLANRNRLLILCNLAEGERSVGELARLIGSRDTAVSQQLALLRKDGIVRTRREGQTIFYDLASSEAAKVIQTLHGIYCSPQGETAGATDAAPSEAWERSAAEQDSAPVGRFPK